jgi:hypothetical protein
VISAASDATNGTLLGLIANGPIVYVQQPTVTSAFVKQVTSGIAISVAG